MVVFLFVNAYILTSVAKLNFFKLKSIDPMLSFCFVVILFILFRSLATPSIFEVRVEYFVYIFCVVYAMSSAGRRQALENPGDR